MTAPTAHARTLSGSSDLSALRASSSTPTFKPNGSAKATPSATTISVRAGGLKSSPMTKDATAMRSAALATAFSTASESELLACGLTAEELEDLELLAGKAPRVKVQPLGRVSQAPDSAKAH